MLEWMLDEKMVQLFRGGGGGGTNIKYLPIVINYMKRKSSKKIKNKLVTRRRSMHGGLTWGSVENSKEYMTLLEENTKIKEENTKIKEENAYLERERTRAQKTPSDLACPPTPRPQTQPTIVTFDFKLLKKINAFPFLKIDESVVDVESVEGGELKTYDHTSSSLRESKPAEQKIYNSFIDGKFPMNITVTVVNSDCNIVGFVECLESTELLYLDINSDSTANYVVLTKSTDKSSLINLSKYYVSADGSTTRILGFSSLRNK